VKRVTAIFLSTLVTVLLVITVLAAGQPRTQASTQPTSSTVVTGAVQAAPASDAPALPQSATGHREHDGGEHQSRGTSSLSLSDD
jgi:hypothetical protein